MMIDQFDPAPLYTSGQLLARVDDVEYREVALVLAWPSNGAPTIYCQRPDWHTTPAARMAALLQSNAELQAMAEASAGEVVRLASRVAQLEAQLNETPVQNQARTFEKQAAYIGGNSDPGACPDCGKTDWKSARALQMHRQRVHQGMQTFKAPPAQLAEDLGWRCAAERCAGAFTRSLSSPDYCVQHAPLHANGSH